MWRILSSAALLILLACLSEPAIAESTGVPEKINVGLDKFEPLGTTGVSAKVSPVSFNVGPTHYRAWCYQTSGMTKLGQPELFVVVLKQPGEADNDFPADPLSLLAGLAKTAQPGQALDELGSARGKAFVPDKFAGYMFVAYNAGEIPGIKVPKNSLAAVNVTPEELEVCKLAGSSRVKTALAQTTSYYPSPIWCDRSRNSVFSKADVELMKQDPFVAKVTHFGSFASALVANDEINLRISHDEGKLLADALAKYKGSLRVSLVTDPRSTTCLTWTPPKTPRRAVGLKGADKSRMSGQFLAIISGLKADRLLHLSDGFVLELTAASSKQLYMALMQNKELTIPLTEGPQKKFTISWAAKGYFNPMDKKTYSSQKGWTLFHPGHNSDASAKKKIDLTKVVLLTGEEQAQAALSEEQLSTYIKALSKSAIDQLAKVRPVVDQKLLVQCSLFPEHADFKVAMNPSEPGMDKNVQSLYTVLSNVKLPACKGEVTFHMVFDVPAAGNEKFGY